MMDFLENEVVYDYVDLRIETVGNCRYEGTSIVIDSRKNMGIP